MLAGVAAGIFLYAGGDGAGSMWWWILPLAPGVPERLIVGNERAFLTCSMRAIMSSTVPRQPGSDR